MGGSPLSVGSWEGKILPGTDVITNYYCREFFRLSYVLPRFFPNAEKTTTKIKNRPSNCTNCIWNAFKKGVKLENRSKISGKKMLFTNGREKNK